MHVFTNIIIIKIKSSPIEVLIPITYFTHSQRSIHYIIIYTIAVVQLSFNTPDFMTNPIKISLQSNDANNHKI